MKYKHLFTSTLLAILITSCNYLDIVPDNIATLEMAFNTRANAEKYLATCYNFVPAAANLDHNSGDGLYGGQAGKMAAERRRHR